jgi:hypothetical protein
MTYTAINPHACCNWPRDDDAFYLFLQKQKIALKLYTPSWVLPHLQAGDALRQLTMHISTNDLHCYKPAHLLQRAPSGGRPRSRPPDTAPPRIDPPHQQRRTAFKLDEIYTRFANHLPTTYGRRDLGITILEDCLKMANTFDNLQISVGQNELTLIIRYCCVPGMLYYSTQTPKPGGIPMGTTREGLIKTGVIGRHFHVFNCSKFSM